MKATESADNARYYKFLNADGTPCHGGSGKWHLPKNGKPGRWMPKIKGDLILCQNGYHLVRDDHLPSFLGPAMYRVEYAGEIIPDTDKAAVRHARLLYRIEAYTDSRLRHFATDCAERALKRAKVEDERSWRAIKVARAFADGKATVGELAAAYSAAGRAAHNAAHNAAYNAAYSAAGSAAYSAAHNATYSAAHNASYSAAYRAERKWQNAQFIKLIGEVA